MNDLDSSRRHGKTYERSKGMLCNLLASNSHEEDLVKASIPKSLAKQVQKSLHGKEPKAAGQSHAMEYLRKIYSGEVPFATKRRET